jgi:hypothetical protein
MEKSPLVDAMRQYDALTDNGAITHSTSLSACLNLFFIAGASRNMSVSDIIDSFLKAHSENVILAYQILFWARDCRGGAGEKRFFRTIAKFLSHNEKQFPNEWEAVACHVPTYGSWKDVFEIEPIAEDVLNWLKTQLEESQNSNLLAKYFPRKGPWFVAMHKYMKLTPKEFRKYLVSKTCVVEHKVCAGEFSKIEYSKVPSVAMNKYREIFMKHDEARFTQFNEDVLAGKTKVNASVLFPHQLYDAIQEGQDVTAVEAQWQSLPDYMAGTTERILPVCDVSGSMHGLPMSVSVSLGLYIAERNKSVFHNAFITFSGSPTMQYIQGNNLRDKMYSIETADWGMNTDLQATFELVLASAMRNSVPLDLMPTKLLIISDMEFDSCAYGTNLDSIRAQYEASGYKFPELIFWNVNGRRGNLPATMSEKGIGLVSGFSPAILASILQGEIETPYQLMMKTISSERYQPIARSLGLV